MALKSVYLPNPTIQDGNITLTDEEHRHLVVARAEIGETRRSFRWRGASGAAWSPVVGKRETLHRVQDEHGIPTPNRRLDSRSGADSNRGVRTRAGKSGRGRSDAHRPFLSRRGPMFRAWSGTNGGCASLSRRRNNRRHISCPMLDHRPSVRRFVYHSRNFSDHVCRTRWWSTKVGSPRFRRCCISSGPKVVGPMRNCRSAESAGFKLVSLGAEILKAETAAIVGASLIRYELGRPCKKS